MQPLPRLALRNLWRNKRRSAVTMAAVLCGVFASVALRGFFNGFIDGMRRDVIEADIGAVQIHRAGYRGSKDALPLKLDMPCSPGFMDRLRAVPGVTAVAGRIAFGGLVSNGTSATAFVGAGIDPVAEPQVTPRAGGVVAVGGLLQPGHDADALLGKELADSLGATLGSSLTLSTSDQRGGMNAMDVSVRGEIVSTVPFQNKKLVKVTLPFAQRLLKMEGRVTEYAVNVRDLNRVEEVSRALQAALGPGYEVSPWDEVQPFLKAVIFRQTLFLSIFTFVLFVIILTIIVNTMTMNVSERTREIGTMMAVGMRRASILRLFLWEAGMLGLLAGGVGAGLGLAAVLWMGHHGLHLPLPGIKTVATFRPFMSAGFLALATALAVLGSLVAAFYPAWRASRLRPVDALRSL